MACCKSRCTLPFPSFTDNSEKDFRTSHDTSDCSYSKAENDPKADLVLLGGRGWGGFRCVLGLDARE